MTKERGVIVMRSIYQKWNEENLFKEFDMEGHAKYSPSKFHQYANCPYSAKFEKLKGDIPERSEAAEIGTAAHDIASAKLIYGKESDEVMKKLLQYAEEGMDANKMNKDANGYVDFVISQIGDYSIVRVEEMLDMSPWIKDVFGTCDCLIFDPNTLTVIDYKYGLKPVEAVDNEQLLAYACGAMIALDYKKRPFDINLVIYQPRARGETLKTWQINYDTLLSKAHAIKENIEKIDRATRTDRHAGPWCEFCGNKICPKRAEFIAEVLQVDTTNEFMSDTEIMGFLTAAKHARRLMDKLESDVNQLYEAGDILQEYEMTYTNGRKVWTDEDEVKEILRKHKMFDFYIVPSPAQLEKKVSQEKWDEWGLNKYIVQTKKKNGFTLS